MPDSLQRVLGALGALVTLPLLILLGLAIRLDSPGPAIHTSRRIGEGGRPFACHKLRTMRVDSSAGPAVTVQSDPRVTALGRFLRRSRLDELPQLWDVARGTMRLVGPRPEAPEYVDLDDPLQAEVFTARPGITGLTQLFGTDESEGLVGPEAEARYRRIILPRKLRLDAAYLRYRSFRLDLWILAWTPMALFGRRPAMPDRIRAALAGPFYPLRAGSTSWQRPAGIHRWRLAASWTWVPRGRHLFVYDLLATMASIVGAFALRFDASNVWSWMAPYIPVCFLPLIVLPPVYVAQGLYRRVWRYASMSEMFALVAAVAIGYGACFVAFVVLAVWDIGGTLGFPRSVWFIEALLSLAFVGGARFLLRAALEQRGGQAGRAADAEPVPTIVYGAGEVGATVARVAARDRAAGLSVVGFLDDDPHKRGVQLMGKRVFGDLDALAEAVPVTGARQLLLAMPEATGATVRRAFEMGRAQGLEVRTVPPPRELLSGEVRLESVRRVSVEDLLRREPVAVDLDAVAGYLNGRSVLVTGGGGSIGSELCRQILALGPRQLTVLDQHEEALWTIERELGERSTGAPGMAFRTVLADVRSTTAMERVIGDVRPEVVFHAAALKHVPIVEQYPAEGVMTNVLGTRNVLRACERAEVGRFVFISTDKAVDPVSAMGATKRIAEHLVVASARRSGRPYVVVRFGNVLGSSGSVIPTFQHQLARGGPLTVTHPDVTRYFMTIGEAVSLILEAASSASPGEVYVLDMGEPVRILDLARDLVRLSGLDPDRVPIVFTGLRAGERLHESLFYDHETTEQTIHLGVLRVRARGGQAPSQDVDALADRLCRAAERRQVRLVRALLGEAQRLGLPGQGLDISGPGGSRPEAEASADDVLGGAQA